jgi:AraC-like DNA-binding protein
MLCIRTPELAFRANMTLALPFFRRLQMPPARTPYRRTAANHVIRVGGASALFPLLRESGVDPEALAAEAGLSGHVFANPDNVVPFAALCRLAHLARERTGLCDVGLRACRATGVASLGLLGYLVANSESVGRGLAALQEFLHVHDEGATAYFATEGDSAMLGYEVLTPGVRGADQVTFGALAIAANVLRDLCGAGLRFHEVTFACRAPADVSLFRSFFAAPVRFDAERSALVFEARWLAARVAGANAYIREILAERICQQAANAPEATGDRFRRVVRSLVAGGKFTVDDLAAAFALSRRTLARRLNEQGTSFHELLDEARFLAARNLLQSSQAPISEIATRLGYRDATAFARAFRRWGRMSPIQWRRTRATI